MNAQRVTRLLPVLAFQAGLGMPATSQADATDEAVALYQSRGCVACHAETQPRMGPAYSQVAERYTAADVDRLVAAVREGSSGTWGDIPMPPHPHVSEEDIEKIVRWVLTLP